MFTFQISDRTHRIALGAKLTATYRDKFKTEELKIEKKVTVNAYVLSDAQENPLIGEMYIDSNKDGKYDEGEQYRDDDGNKAYTPRLTKALALARFDKDLVVANESYAQVGVRLVPGVSKVITAPAALANGEVLLSNQAIGSEAKLTATEKAIVLEKFNTTDNKDDIEVYYVVNAMLENKTGNPSAF